MAMGQQKDRQVDLMVGCSEMPRSPGHVFYDRLQSALVEADFDAFAEATCKPFYAAKMGAPSVPPGRYFRMHLDSSINRCILALSPGSGGEDNDHRRECAFVFGFWLRVLPPV